MRPPGANAPTTAPTVGQLGVRPNVSSPGSSGAPQVASKLQSSGYCCTIASVDLKNSIVTARQVTGGQALQFTAPQSLFQNLKVRLLGSRIRVEITPP